MKPGSRQRRGEAASPSGAPVRQRRSVAVGYGKQGGRPRRRGAERGGSEGAGIKALASGEDGAAEAGRLSRPWGRAPVDVG